MSKGCQLQLFHGSCAIFFRWLFVSQLATQLAPYQQWECTTRKWIWNNDTLCHPEKNIAPKWEEVNLLRWLPFLGDVRAWGGLILAPNNYGYVLNKWWQTKKKQNHSWTCQTYDYLEPQWPQMFEGQSLKRRPKPQPKSRIIWVPGMLKIVKSRNPITFVSTPSYSPLKPCEVPPTTSSRGPVWRSANSQTFGVNQLTTVCSDSGDTWVSFLEIKSSIIYCQFMVLFATSNQDINPWGSWLTFWEI